MNDIQRQIDRAFSAFNHVCDASEIMKGLGLLLDEFQNGNTFTISDPSPFMLRRVSDILAFTSTTLIKASDELQKGQVTLEHAVIDLFNEVQDQDPDETESGE